MPGPAWELFVIGSLFLAVAVVVLARRTARLLGSEDSPIPALPRSTLYLNVAVSHGLVLGVLGLLGWWTGVPLRSMGPSLVPDLLQFGILTGGLIGFNEVADRFARRIDLPDNPLRALLTPETAFEWVALVGGVLPLIALTEEVLFRGVLIGAFSLGTPIPPLVLLLGSSVLFGAAHTAQGRLGVSIAALLGLMLGAAYLWSGSLLLVIGAHYLVDLVEFARHRDLVPWFSEW